MKVIISGGKGGTGKTMVSASISYILSKYLDVIAVDADVDTPNLHLILGANFEEEYEIYSKRAIGRSKNPCNCPFGAIEFNGGYYVVNQRKCEGCGFCEEVCEGFKLVDVVSGWVKVGKTRYNFPIISGFLKPGLAGSGKIVDETIRKALEIGENLVIDSAAGIGCPVISAFKYADVAIFVLEPTKQSLLAFKRIRKIAEHFGVDWYVILNKSNLNERIRFERTILEIPYDERIIEAINNLRPPAEVIRDFGEKLKEALRFIGIL